MNLSKFLSNSEKYILFKPGKFDESVDDIYFQNEMRTIFQRNEIMFPQFVLIEFDTIKAFV